MYFITNKETKERIPLSHYHTLSQSIEIAENMAKRLRTSFLVKGQPGEDKLPPDSDPEDYTYTIAEVNYTPWCNDKGENITIEIGQEPSIEFLKSRNSICKAMDDIANAPKLFKKYILSESAASQEARKKQFEEVIIHSPQPGGISHIIYYGGRDAGKRFQEELKAQPGYTEREIYEMPTVPRMSQEQMAAIKKLFSEQQEKAKAIDLGGRAIGKAFNAHLRDLRESLSYHKLTQIQKPKSMFYLLTENGTKPPKHKHTTIQSAQQEAMRLNRQFGEKVEILEIVGTVETKEVPVTEKRTVVTMAKQYEDLPF